MPLYNLGIPRLQLLLITFLCVYTLVKFLRYAHFLGVDKSLWRIHPNPKHKPLVELPVIVLTPRTRTSEALWVREEQVVRPPCRQNYCKESCVDEEDEAVHMKLKWDCFSVKNFSESKEANCTTTGHTFFEYKPDRLARLPDLPTKLSLLFVGDSTARQLYQSLKALRDCTSVFHDVLLQTFSGPKDEFEAVNLGGRGATRANLRISHDLEDISRNRISLAWANRLLDGEGRVDVAHRKPENWVTRRYWKEVIKIARGEVDNRVALVFSFGPHFNGLSRRGKQDKARQLLNHTSRLLRLGELLEEEDALVFLNVNGGIVANDTDSKSSKYYHDWKAQEKFFNREFPKLVLRPSGVKSYVFNSTFMQRIKAGRDSSNDDLMHFQHPGRAPLDELVYAILCATRLL